MKKLFLCLMAVGALVLAGCASNDFKVVDALRVGMTKQEAHETIAKFAYKNEDSLDRPLAGWPQSDSTFTNLAGRARTVEEETKTTIGRAECYPMGDGTFGFGQLFLFYSESGQLVRFYRRQVN